MSQSILEPSLKKPSCFNVKLIYTDSEQFSLYMIRCGRLAGGRTSCQAGKSLQEVKNPTEIDNLQQGYF